MKILKNRVMRKAFISKRAKITSKWRKKHNEKLRNLCSLPNIIRKIKSRRKIFILKLEGERPL